MSGKLALVTGGAGFIGRHVVRCLLERGRRVRILDSVDSDAIPEPFLESAGQVDHITGSVLDVAVLAEAMASVDEVYHLAGNAHLWARDKTSFHSVNVEGTRTVLEAARGAGVARMVVTSSETVFYAAGGHGGVIDERTPRRPASEMPGPYCRSKHEAERLCLDAAADGLPVTLVYPTLPIGPGDSWLTPPTRMIADFVNGGTPAFLDCMLNLVAVEDVALGHVLAAERGAPGAQYILGNENLRVGEILAHLEAITGIVMPRRRIPYALAYVVGAVSETISDFVTRRPPMAPFAGVRLARHDMRFDCGRAVNDLGLAPTPIREALARQLAWLRDAGHLTRPMPAFSDTEWPADEDAGLAQRTGTA